MSLLPNLRRRNQDLDEEVQAHFRMAIRDRMDSGLNEKQATAAARREFGNTELFKATTREVWGWTWLERLRQDVGFGLRMLRKSPGFTAVAAITLALGIGANTAIFSVINGVLIRSLPFPNANELVWIANGFDEAGLSGRTHTSFDYRDFRERSRTISGMAAYNAFFPYNSYNLTGRGDPERPIGVDVTCNFFRVLGVVPLVGRNFTPEECVRQGPLAVILSNGYWKTRFASDPGVVGQHLTINGQSLAVVGVMPPSFDFASVFVPGAKVDMFLPRYIDKDTASHGNEVSILGRIKPGATLGAAQSELAELARREGLERGWGPDGVRAHLQFLTGYVTGDLRRPLLVLMLAVGFVLLIACANLSNLLLARAETRKREMGFRLAIGASRVRLVRQLLTESVLLALLGSLLALPLAYVGTRVLASLRHTSIPLLGQVGIDVRAFCFALGLAVLTGVLFGLVPAIHASRCNINDALKEGASGAGGGIRRSWTRSALVVSEVALSCVLLGGAGLMLKSLLKLLDIDPGFRSDHVAVVRIDPGPQMWDHKIMNPYLDRIVAAVRPLPGIEAASISDALPFDRDRSWGFSVPGIVFPKGQEPGAFIRTVGPGYFDAMRIPLLMGRDFDAHDQLDTGHVVIVNQTFVNQIFQNQNPLDRVVNINDKSRIVGVVADVKHSALDQPSGLEAYFPYTQGDTESPDLVVRTTLPPDKMASVLRKTIWSFAPAQPLNEFRTMDQLVDTATSSRRFTTLLLGIFAVLALVLASVGIYGVISYSVTQRTRELGIRMALGANGRTIEWLVTRDVLTLAAAGALFGIVGLAVLGRSIAGLLYGVTATDPAVFGGVVFLFIAVGAVSAYIPARRAARVDPMAALRLD
jgi:putative ABC transport system permease protein